MLLPLAIACTTLDVASEGEPSVAISSPENGASFLHGESFTVTASLNDTVDPTALSVEWAVTPDPGLSGNALKSDTEASLFFADGLPEGDFTIAVTVTNPSGATDSDSVAVAIGSNNPPIVSILEPNKSESYTFGDPLVVEVQVKAKDDEMSAIALTWGGVAEGSPEAPDRPPDSGTVIFNIEGVPEGHQKLSVTATDSGGETDVDDVSFWIY